MKKKIFLKSWLTGKFWQRQYCSIENYLWFKHRTAFLFITTPVTSVLLFFLLSAKPTTTAEESLAQSNDSNTGWHTTSIKQLNQAVVVDTVNYLNVLPSIASTK